MKLLLILAVVVSSVFAFPPLENPNLFEGDLILSPDQQRQIKEGIANHQYAAVVSNKWPTTTIAWSASSEILNSKKAMTAINAAFDEYHRRTCIKYKRRTNEKSYIYFYKGEGCNSRVGYFYGVNKISLDGPCQNKGTAVHEMFHSLGFYHEQSRPDRDSYVKIIWDNVPYSGRKNYQKYPRSSIDSRGVPYDYLSISHYRKDQFSPGRTSIVTLDKSYQDKIGGQQNLSVLDIEQLSIMYRCQGTKTLPPTLTPPTKRPQFCEDENGASYCKPLIKWCKNTGTLGVTLKRQCYKSCGYC